MKKWLFLLIAALVFAYHWNTYAEEIQVCLNCTTEVTSNFCPDCGESNVTLLPELQANEGYLTLKINYQKNRILAKYDVHIYVDGTHAATLRHNETLQKIIPVKQGLHEIIVKADNDNTTRTMVNVSEKTRLTFAIKTHLFSIDIKDVETNGPVSATEQLNYETNKFLASCHAIDYDHYSRYPEQYQNEPIHLKGKVVSTAENFAGMMKVVVKDARGNLWIVQYNRTSSMPRILLDDSVEIFGHCQGISTYKSSVDVYPLLPTISLVHLNIN